MVNKFIILLFGGLLLGCNGAVHVKTDVQESFVPILYCPKPSIPDHPILPIHQMTPDQLNTDGEVVKHYKATVKLLQGHIMLLESELGRYKMSNEAYDKLKAELIDKIKNGELDSPPVR